MRHFQPHEEFYCNRDLRENQNRWDDVSRCSSSSSLSSSSFDSNSDSQADKRVRDHQEFLPRTCHSGDDYNLKNAHEALDGSTLALINFLKSEGVSTASIEQLERNRKIGRYFAVLHRAQNYLACLEHSPDTNETKVCLAVYAWEALCRYKALEYKEAYKQSFRLRYEIRGSSAREVQVAISRQTKLAEHCTLCQKKLYLVRKWQRQMQSGVRRVTNDCSNRFRARTNQPSLPVGVVP